MKLGVKKKRGGREEGEKERRAKREERTALWIPTRMVDKTPRLMTARAFSSSCSSRPVPSVLGFCLLREQYCAEGGGKYK